ncbi:MAG: peptidylprolyl isomerase [Deinococcus sp.]|nr:peptidylprolyl isomerase [Deinococcus sp.]
MKQLIWTLPALLLASCAPVQQMGLKDMAQRDGTTEARYQVPVSAVMDKAEAAQPDGGWQALPYLVPQAQAPSTFARAEQVTEPGKQYRAVLNTSRGLITLELYPDKAPQAVNNFIFLARNHFYAGTRFHRVIDGFMAQGGDPLSTDVAQRDGWGTGGPGYSFGYEVESGLTFNEAGVLGMARSASPDSQGSQFFITLAPASFLNGQYTVFGRVVSGMDVLQALTKTSASGAYGEQPIPGAEADVLNSVTILTH